MVTERQCLADSLVYARFYLPILGADLDEAALRDPISEAIGADSLAALERWTATLPRRLGEPEGLPFWSLPTFMRELFSVPPEHLLPRLAAMYQAELPDRLLILTASAEALEARLQAKHRGATPRELHEQAHVIAMFQEGLHAAGAALQQADPKLAVVTLDTTDQTPEQTEAWIATRLEENWR